MKKTPAKYIGRIGGNPVYKTKYGKFGIAQYANITQILPVRKDKTYGYTVTNIYKVKNIKRTGSLASELAYAKKYINRKH